MRISGKHIDYRSLRILSGYIASGASLRDAEKYLVTVSPNSLTVKDPEGEMIVISEACTDKTISENTAILCLNKAYGDGFVHTYRSSEHEYRWITLQRIDIYVLTGLFIGFQTIKNDIQSSIEHALDTIKNMTNDNPVSALWNRLVYQSRYERLLNAIERLSSRISLIKDFPLRTNEILVGYYNDDGSIYTGRIIIWGDQILSLPPIRTISIREELPIKPISSKAFICLKNTGQDRLYKMICNERYCCLDGEDPVKLAIQVEKSWRTKR